MLPASMSVVPWCPGRVYPAVMREGEDGAERGPVGPPGALAVRRDGPERRRRALLVRAGAVGRPAGSGARRLVAPGGLGRARLPRRARLGGPDRGRRLAAPTPPHGGDARTADARRDPVHRARRPRRADAT